MLLSILGIALGLAALVKGGDWLVDGASSLARKWGVAPIVIGLTIVAFGTSAPELVVSTLAAASGNTEIAIGNVVGSNIANILLILGITGCIMPLTIKKNTTWKELPLMALAALLVWIMSSDRLLAGGTTDILDRIDGLVLLSFFPIFLYYTVGIAKEEKSTEDVVTYSVPASWMRVAGGLALLVIGGRSTVDGATALALAAGVPDRIIALTIVAVGTSLPELVTSVTAALRKNADIAIGNIVGSNIFNVFWILGLSATINPLPFSSQNAIDALVATFASILLFVAMLVGRRHVLQRWQSICFLVLYAGYVGALIVTG